MQTERMQILKMLEEGRISAQDAARLLDAVAETPSGDQQAAPGKRLRIRVTNPRTSKQSVNISIPIGLAKLAAKFIPHKAKQKLAAEGIDVDAVMSQVLAENVGKIVDVESDEENVQISIE